MLCSYIFNSSLSTFDILLGGFMLSVSSPKIVLDISTLKISTHDHMTSDIH
jgi:hypothetical protein